MDLALIYERISTFTGFITTAFLIFGYKLTIVQEVKNIIVEGPFDLKKWYLMLYLIVLVIMVFNIICNRE